jgi:Domain of Unknown Function (DUF928)
MTLRHSRSLSITAASSKLLLTTALVVQWFIPFAPPARAESFNPPLGRSASSLTGYRQSSAARCGCTGGGLHAVILLLPEDGTALTTEAYPTFQWYVPTEGENRVEFSLYEVDLEQNIFNPVYQTSFHTTGEPGIASYQLPAGTALPPLTQNKLYYWEVGFFCDPNDCEADLMANGWVRRIDPHALLESQLERATLSERATLAAANGLWLDASGTLARLLQENPDDTQLQARWQELLNSVELDMLSDQPFIHWENPPASAQYTSESTSTPSQ